MRDYPILHGSKSTSDYPISHGCKSTSETIQFYMDVNQQ